MDNDQTTVTASATLSERDQLARLMCATFQGISVESITDEEWPATDVNVKRWTAVAEAVLASKSVPAQPAAVQNSAADRPAANTARDTMELPRPVAEVRANTIKGRRGRPDRVDHEFVLLDPAAAEGLLYGGARVERMVGALRSIAAAEGDTRMIAQQALE